ncbi:MAG: glycosyltransferase family 2 protein, partial [Aeoliella sp.]
MNSTETEARETTLEAPVAEASVVNRLKDAERAIRDCIATYGPEGTAALADIGAELDPIELSVVMPCLNEADTLATCIEKAQRAMREHNIVGEIVIADNGSTDSSIEIATEMGARVVNVEAKGYGSALMGGIEAARGRYILMGDADDSYDFLELPKFVDKLREGHSLVQGCRLPSGGGKVLPGAMPPLH